jgi:high-affinity nickel-transport protein
MCKAYNWAILNPLRKIFYNIATTALSIAVALVIGSIELMQVFIGLLHLHGTVYDFIGGLDFGVLGYLIVGLFLFGWLLSVTIWKATRMEERYEGQHATHRHPHSHDGDASHSHEHVH